MKTIVEPSYGMTSAKKTRKPHPIDNKPTFKSTSEIYKNKFLILSRIKIEDKIKVVKAIEKNNNVGEIWVNSSNRMLKRRASAVRENPAKVSVILSLCR
jgi:hypothetical protein